MGRERLAQCHRVWLVYRRASALPTGTGSDHGSLKPPNWFRSNWSLAHELAHLALGHHAGDHVPGEAEELPADEFAANLLLPEELVRQHDWQSMGEQELARFLWETGVSTVVVKNRLATLKKSILRRYEAVNSGCGSS
ncbi:ImmA/IrrE family metallo-endopeptidase [Nocardia sp. NPDC058666]|uniref:ImmA/IrrE family metallo-endopeptidase n=1 Tax=Nocardia sp. NPDC058666 TaxID=3346587 RepID=UPI003660E331